MRKRTKVLAWLGGLATAVAVTGFCLVWALGPTVGTMLTGAPVFPVPPSPERYASAALDLMERAGIHGDSPEFARARAEAERMLDAADLKDYSDTWPALDLAIAAAGGKHSKVIRPNGSADGSGGPDPAAAEPTVTSEAVRGGAGDGRGARVLTATVPTHGGDGGGPESQRYADVLASGIAREVGAGACGAIVDLRGNDGGDMGPMVAGLSALLPDGELLWFDGRGYSSAVTLSGGSIRGGGSAITVDAGPKADIPVAVLVDGDTASSAEATMLTFRGLDRSRSFGSPTAGYASANVVTEFPGGAKLMLTVAKDRDRTGAVHMDDPIWPDEITGDGTDAGPDTGNGAGPGAGAGDHVKAAALAWLSTRGCG